MIYNYREALMLFNSDYQLKKALNNKKLYKLEAGIYSDNEFSNELILINKKYPTAIFTSDSAYYYHNLTDVIPQKYFLATDRKSSKIRNNKIKQIYMANDKLKLGITKIEVNGIEINIYDKEKLLIELVKNSKKIPFDYYKEIIHNYRNISDTLNVNKIADYLSYYKNDIKLFIKIQKEVL